MITLNTYNCKTVSGSKAVINCTATDGNGNVLYATGYACDDFSPNGRGRIPGPKVPCKWTADGKTEDRAMEKFDLVEA